MLKIYPENVEANRSNKKKGKVDRVIIINILSHYLVGVL